MGGVDGEIEINALSKCWIRKYLVPPTAAQDYRNIAQIIFARGQIILLRILFRPTSRGPLTPFPPDFRSARPKAGLTPFPFSFPV